MVVATQGFPQKGKGITQDGFFLVGWGPASYIILVRHNTNGRLPMARAAAASLPAPSKQAGDENFPVASWLLARDKRNAVMAFYRFARQADDIADSPDLDRGHKIAQLDNFERGLGGLSGAPVALALHGALGGNSRLLAHASALLQAFRRDCLCDHCHSWADLMAYCACSAAPVGRFLLDLHGEDESLHPQADSLCDALQVLNHLQDCGDDYTRLGRVYLPADWMAAVGMAPAHLAACGGGAPLRHVMDLMLDRVDMLLDRADNLPSRLKDRRLAMEAAIIIQIGRRLAALLRNRDPLTGRVALSPLAYGAACLGGVWQGLWTRA